MRTSIQSLGHESFTSILIIAFYKYKALVGVFQTYIIIAADLGVGEGETVPGAVPALRLVPLSRRLGLTLRLPPPEQWSDTRACKYFYHCLCRQACSKQVKS